MRLPEEMRITVFGDGTPLQGMLVCVKIQMQRKNHFSFGFGPTNAGGIVTVTYNDLLREAEKDSRLAMMDYGHIDSESTGTIFVMALNRNALRRALDACKLYYDVSDYPPNYAHNLEEAITILEGGKLSCLSVTVQHRNECIVKCISVKP